MGPQAGYVLTGFTLVNRYMSCFHEQSEYTGCMAVTKHTSGVAVVSIHSVKPLLQPYTPSGLQFVLEDDVMQVSGCEAFAMSHMHRQTQLACVKGGIQASRVVV